MKNEVKKKMMMKLRGFLYQSHGRRIYETREQTFFFTPHHFSPDFLFEYASHEQPFMVNTDVHFRDFAPSIVIVGENPFAGERIYNE
jgi:hypothetical protein